MKFFLVIVLSLLTTALAAQDSNAVNRQPDTLGRRNVPRRTTTVHRVRTIQRVDSLPRMTDSLRQDSVLKDTTTYLPGRRDSIHVALQSPFLSDSFRFRKQPFFTFTNPVRYTITERQWDGKDVVFYIVIALLIVFALIKNSFHRYLTDLLSIYFRTTVRQRQIKEQLMQSPLPSLMFNLFFVLSGGVFLCLLLQHFGMGTQFSFWMLAVYCAAALGVIYLGKFLILKFFGWVFQMSDVTDTYSFVVYSTNKILGVALLPFIVLLAFTFGAVNAASLTIGLVVIAGLLLYRYFLAWLSLNRTVHLSFFHLLVYLAACEVLPLLLINKLLFVFLSEIS